MSSAFMSSTMLRPETAPLSASPVSGGDESLTATSAGKALSVLDAFRVSAGPIGVSEVARLAKVPKSTAFRLLAILSEGGYVERVNKLYQLTWRTFELGDQGRNHRSRGLYRFARPHLYELATMSAQVVQLTVLDGGDALVLESIGGTRFARMVPGTGARQPAHCTAAGKSILAFSGSEVLRSHVEAGLTASTPYSIVHPPALLEELRTVHRDGFALEFGEAITGLASVAAPVMAGDRAIAAVSLTAPLQALDTRGSLQNVRDAAAKIANTYMVAA